ncbi:MAG: gliding motility-associated C-terminal domain-containing protein [Saprospiraceae bacterium]|nr:gliding motility-associated C-terminal domain-containing protein [Saprospiraceae bacterium]
MATEDSTHLIINRYSSTGSFISTSNLLLQKAGLFHSISNGDGATPFSVAEVFSDKNWPCLLAQLNPVKSMYRRAFRFHQNVMARILLKPRTLKLIGEMAFPYFCYILLEDASAKVDFNGKGYRIDRFSEKADRLHQLVYDQFQQQPGGQSSNHIHFECSKIICGDHTNRRWFFDVGYFSNLIDQPPVPNVLYIRQGDCPAGSALLSAGTHASDYQWYLDGKALSGAHDSVFIATKAGVYHIGGHLPCGEYQESAPVSVVFDSVPNGRLVVESCAYYQWYDSTYTESGMFTKLVQNEKGCDSLATLELQIHKSTQSEWSEEACSEFTWLVNGKTYMNSGTFRDTLINDKGCDSILSLNLTIHPSSFQTQVVEACKSYFWSVSGLQYDKSGFYRDTLINHRGCDSILELQLQIVEPSFSKSSIRSCREYTWPVNGTRYDRSGLYRDTLLTAKGCDSILVLELEILGEDRMEESVDVCETYVWPTNNRKYWKSGTYTERFKNADGCDSLRILHLNIRERSSDTQRIALCNRYQWPINGRDYTKSGLYTDTLVNHLGCDSIVFLDLSIFRDYNLRDTQRQCGEYYWYAADRTFKAGGDYQLNLQTHQGCDSVINLHLHIDPQYLVVDTVNALDRFFWPVTNRLYEQEGIFESHFQTTNGCDSLHVLILKIRKRGDVFIPNVFTPNGDGVNDRFIVFSTPEIKEIQRLRIYDRWGQMVFEQHRFPPNEYAFGWDGKFNSQISNPSVFVCTVEWVDNEGGFHMLSGDVTSYAENQILISNVIRKWILRFWIAIFKEHKF